MDWNIVTPIHGSEYWVEEMKTEIEIDGKNKESFNSQWCYDFDWVRGIVMSMVWDTTFKLDSYPHR